MNVDIFNIIGFIGTASYIAGYLLLQLNKISQGYTYIALNIIGASFLIISLTKHWNAPSFVIQSVWIIISFIGIYLLLKNKDYEYHISLCENTEEPKKLVLVRKNKIEKEIDFNKINWKEYKNKNIKTGTYFSNEKETYK